MQKKRLFFFTDDSEMNVVALLAKGLLKKKWTYLKRVQFTMIGSYFQRTVELLALCSIRCRINATVQCAHFKGFCVQRRPLISPIKELRVLLYHIVYHIVSYHIVLYIVLCYVMLCYVMLYYIILYYIILYYIILYYIILYYGTTVTYAVHRWP